jgi:triacylglycerol lipase
MKYLILVHGIGDTGKIFNKMSKQLIRPDLKILVCEIKPADGSLTIEQMARQLAKFINKNIPKKAEIILLGFSMGGIVAKYYICKKAKQKNISKLITISSPHHGTYTAYLLNLPGVKEMRPKSDLLEKLRLPESVAEYTISTPLDLMIVPADSSKVPAAKNYSVPCVAHPLMLKNTKVINIVKKILS